MINDFEDKLKNKEKRYKLQSQVIIKFCRQIAKAIICIYCSTRKKGTEIYL